jgi:hypothetical protein
MRAAQEVRDNSDPWAGQDRLRAREFERSESFPRDALQFQPKALSGKVVRIYRQFGRLQFASRSLDASSHERKELLA